MIIEIPDIFLRAVEFAAAVAIWFFGTGLLATITMWPVSEQPTSKFQIWLGVVLIIAWTCLVVYGFHYVVARD